jgi:hypothetical protein
MNDASHQSSSGELEYSCDQFLENTTYRYDYLAQRRE